MAACAQTQFVVTVANIGVGAVLAVLLGMGGGVQFDAPLPHAASVINQAIVAAPSSSFMGLPEW